jgi:hypothetical protein
VKSSGSGYFFIYHPGTDWHASFENLLEGKSLPTLLGYTHSLELIGHYISEMRLSIGVKATVHVLMPSAHTYVVRDDFTLEPSLFPIKFEGELGYSARPHVWINMPTVQDACFSHISRVPQTKQTNKPRWNGRNRSLIGTSVAVPSGIVGGFGGAAAGLVGLALLTPIGFPALVVGAVVIGAVAGTTTAMGTGTIAEKIYDATHADPNE